MRKAEKNDSVSSSVAVLAPLLAPPTPIEEIELDESLLRVSLAVPPPSFDSEAEKRLFMADEA